MDELKQQLMAKLGLSEAMSDQAIAIVLGFVKDKLPDNMQGMVDSLIDGETPDSIDLLSKAKGLFGG
ncbi:MAG: hypothetical protein ACSHX0_11570 [Akkermansiaceae bacterium]